MTAGDYTVDAIAKALEDTIKAHIPVESKLYTYTLPNSVARLPAAAIEPIGAHFELDLKNKTHVWEFIIYVVVGADHLPTSRSQLGKFTSGRGENSIPRIIFENRDLGLTGPDDPDVEAFVYQVYGYNVKFPWYNDHHLGAALLTRVYIS